MRKTLFWLSTTSDIAFLSTEQVTKAFGVKRGMHPVFTSMEATEIDGVAGVLFVVFDQPNIVHQIALADNKPEPFVIIDETTPGNPASVFNNGISSKEYFTTRELAAAPQYAHRDFTSFPFHAWDNIILMKGAAAQVWEITLEYTLEPGAMMWADEWGELFSQRKNVAEFETVAGGQYHQVGKYFQIGKRELSA